MLLNSLMGYVNASEGVLLHLMKTEKKGELKVVINARKPEGAEAALFPPLVFTGMADELDASLPAKIGEFMNQRGEVETDLNKALEAMKAAAEERKKTEQDKTKKPAPTVKAGKQPKTDGAKEQVSATPQKQETAPQTQSIGLFDEEPAKPATEEATFVAADAPAEKGGEA